MSDKKNSAIADVDIADVLGLGAALGEPKNINAGGAPYSVTPPGWEVHDLSKFLDQPKRPTGSIAFGDVESFIRYVNKHKDTPGKASAAAIGNPGDKQPANVATAVTEGDPDDMQTIILVDVIKSIFRVQFDHHASDAPGWNDFGATYTCPLSKEWQAWMASNGKKMDQESFAFFVEQQALDIVEPSGAEMLTVVTTLKSTKNVVFDSGIRLNDGQVQLKYHEQSEGKAGASGELKIPEQIKLGIPVYVGGPAYEVVCKFRYRMNAGRIEMWYDILRPERILEDSLDKVVDKVAEGTGIKPYAVTAVATK
jgi:uncharacterized protein YfdQ (DUF2303 family)